jgi:hypothetical protein
MKAYFDSDWYEEFVKGAARAYWVTSWASEMEERGKSFSGMDLEDVAPETPLDAYVAAGVLTGLLTALNRTSVYTLADRAAKADGTDGVAAHEFGWYLAMMSMGEGVGWFDNHETFKLEVPMMEYHPEIP